VFFVFINIEHHTTFALVMKIAMGILLVLDILVYFIYKFTKYPISWAIYSILLDILTIPILILIALGLMAGNDRNDDY